MLTLPSLWYTCRKKNITQLLEINNTTKEYIYNKGKISEKKDSTDFTFEDKMDAISNSRFILIKDYDVNLIANALAVSTIPVIADHIHILDLVENKHYVKESKYKHNMKYAEIKKNCSEYYQDNISTEGYRSKLFDHILIRSI